MLTMNIPNPLSLRPPGRPRNSSMVLSFVRDKLGPASLLGGTAMIYSSVLKHPSSTLTPVSLAYMMLLALQYSVQPTLSRQYIAQQDSKQAVAFWEEVSKTIMALVLFVMTGKDQNRLADWSLDTSLLLAGLPAVLYAFQGVLQYTSHQHLDSVTFNGLTQAKTLSAALSCFLLLGKPQSPLQITALMLLFISALLFQKKDGQGIPLIGRFFGQPIEQSKRRQQDKWFWLGVVPCLGATFLSGLAGALSQKGLQWTNGTGNGRDPFLYTVEVSVYSAVTLLVSIFISKMTNRKQRISSGSGETGQSTNSSLFSLSPVSLIPIICKAAGGVLTALVHKHAGSVSKGFALMFGLVLSTMLQNVVTVDRAAKEGESSLTSTLPLHHLVGTLLVMLSGWMHFTNPPRAVPSP